MNDIEDLILVLPWKPRHRPRMEAASPDLTLQSGRDRVEMPASDEGEGGGMTPVGALVITEDGITWGLVETAVPDGLSDTHSGHVWVEITMQTSAPYGVVSAEIKSGSSYPDTSDPPYLPDPETGKPPAKVVFPLGIDSGDSIQNTNGIYGGSIGIHLESVGTTCRPADPGDPESEPPIPPKEGGIVDMLQWVTYRK